MLCPPPPGRRRRPLLTLLLPALLFLPLTACEPPGDALAGAPETSDLLHASFDNFNDPDPNATAPTRNQDLTGRQVYPKDNWWNLEVTDFPVDPNSDAYIAFIGRDMRTHPDFAKPPYGIPYIVVPGDQPLEPITYVKYGNESDSEWSGRPGGFPIPVEARTEENWIQQGVPGGHTTGDRHLSIIDRDNWVLYELWNTYWNVELQRWEAGSGAVFDLNSNQRRPEGWTSADAAGMALFPGYVRYDEVFGQGEIEHAFRVTLSTTNGYVWPANHKAGATQGALPMGARLRLKPDVDLSGYPPEAQKIFRALKKYGLIVADNGGPLFITGTMDPRWNNHILNPAFHSLTGKDFEVLELGYEPETTEPPTSPPPPSDPPQDPPQDPPPSDPPQDPPPSDPPTENQLPTADPGGPYAEELGATVQLDGSGSSDPEGPVVGWAWDFGDGTKGSGERPTHVYPAAGTYTVSLIVKDGDDASSAAVETTVEIRETPKPNISLDAWIRTRSKQVRLYWTGAVGKRVDVERNGVVVKHTRNDGAARDMPPTTSGSYTYRLCERGTATCSNPSTVVYGATASAANMKLRTRVESDGKVRLDWSGAPGSRVDIERNGVVHRSTTNDGATKDRVPGSGTYKYRICEQDTGMCTAASTAVVP